MKTKEFFLRYVGYIVVLLISAIYIATALIQVQKTGKTIYEIVADGTLIFILGFAITKVFDLQGLITGEQSIKVQNTLCAYADTIEKVTPVVDKLDGWCDMKNAENLKRQRTVLLSKGALKYDNCFNEDGSPKDLTFTDRVKAKWFDKAISLTLTPLTASNLMSDNTKTQDIFNFGRTKAEYEREVSGSDFISKLIIAVIFGYYTVKEVKDFSYADLLWKCLQVCIMVVMGVIKMIRSYLYVTEEWRGRIIKKINYLEMFNDYIGGKNNAIER